MTEPGWPKGVGVFEIIKISGYGENSKDLILEHRISEAIASARSAAFEEAAKIVRENDANAVDVEKLILQHAKGDGK